MSQFAECGRGHNSPRRAVQRAARPAPGLLWSQEGAARLGRARCCGTGTVSCCGSAGAGGHPRTVTSCEEPSLGAGPMRNRRHQPLAFSSAFNWAPKVNFQPRSPCLLFSKERWQQRQLLGRGPANGWPSRGHTRCWGPGASAGPLVASRAKGTRAAATAWAMGTSQWQRGTRVHTHLEHTHSHCTRVHASCVPARSPSSASPRCQRCRAQRHRTLPGRGSRRSSAGTLWGTVRGQQQPGPRAAPRERSASAWGPPAPARCHPLARHPPQGSLAPGRSGSPRGANGPIV